MQCRRLPPEQAAMRQIRLIPWAASISMLENRTWTSHIPRSTPGADSESLVGGPQIRESGRYCPGSTNRHLPARAARPGRGADESAYAPRRRDAAGPIAFGPSRTTWPLRARRIRSPIAVPLPGRYRGARLTRCAPQSAAPVSSSAHVMAWQGQAGGSEPERIGAPTRPGRQMPATHLPGAAPYRAA